MTTKKDFLKKFSIYAVGNISSKLIMFLLYPVMTFYLSPEELGPFDVVLSMAIWLGTLAMLNMRDGAFRFIMVNDKKVFQRVLKLFMNILLWNAILLTIGASVIYFTGIDLFFNPYLIVLFFLSFNFFEVYQQIIRGEGETKLYVTANIISAFLIAIITILLLKATDLKANSLVIAYTVSKLLAALYVEMVHPIIFRKREKFNDSTDDNYSAKRILLYSLFLLPANLAITGIENWGRLFILSDLGEYWVGIYAIVLKFGNIFFVLTAIYQQTWQECAIRDYDTANRNQYFTKYFNNYLIFLTLLVVAITGGVQLFYKLLMAPEYYESVKYIPFQLFSIMFFALSSFLRLGYECSFQVNRAMYSALLATLVSFVLNAYLVQYWGILGSVISNIVAGLTMFVYRFIEVRRYFIIKLNKLGLLAIIILIMIIVWILSFNNLYW